MNVVKSERKPRRTIQYKDFGKFEPPQHLTRCFSPSSSSSSSSSSSPSHRLIIYITANAVSRIDNLTFLEDVVPKTTTYREFKSRNKGRGATNQEGAPLQNGQMTIDASSNRTLVQRPAGRRRSSPIEIVDEPSGPSMEEEEEDDRGGVRVSPGQPHMPNGQQLIFEHYEPNGNVRVDSSGDVEMG